MLDFLNANGLVDGLIPIGDPCPFHETCAYKTGNCPTEDNPKQNPFSCGLARLHSILLLRTAENDGRAAAG
jgi:hypothetical protein